ncbi:MAG: flagellar protein FlaG [Bryobacteraceae bacterium]
MEISSAYDVSQAVDYGAQRSTVTAEARAENRQVTTAVRQLNEANAFGDDNELTFALDRQTGRALVRIVDKKTNELIRQIPPEYVVRMAEEMRRRVAAEA